MNRDVRAESDKILGGNLCRIQKRPAGTYLQVSDALRLLAAQAREEVEGTEQVGGVAEDVGQRGEIEHG